VGGGAYGGIFYHCYFVSNTVYGYADNYSSGGGGACQSTLYDSCIASNRALVVGRGGGCLSCVLSNCVVAYNETDYHGGGAADSTLYNCIVRGNVANTSGGGGGASCTFWNCVLTENKAKTSGGGAGWSTVHNCLVISNQAANNGGGLYSGTNYNCTIIENTAHTGGGFYGADNPSQIYNCIIFGNTASGSSSNWGGSILSRNSCSIPQLIPPSPAYGNITNDPAFLDAAFHLSATSPCRGKGSSLYASGTDLDGEIWNSPPAMGADEVYDADFTGALSVAIQSPQTNLLVNRSLALAGLITGRASGLAWSFGDGIIVSNVSYFTSHLWTNAGDYSVVFTAYNTDNPGGVSTNLLVHVLPLDPPLLQSISFSLSSSDGFQFQFNGQSNAIYTVQVATNLVPPVMWQNLQTITSTGGVVQVTDANATNVTSFYRVGVQ
jgi:parallel beta-helix repeat protein